VGADPVDHGKPGSKLYLVCEGGGLPPAAVVTAANLADILMFTAVLDDVPRFVRRRGGGAPASGGRSVASCAAAGSAGHRVRRP
jgi:hypothetical protein